MYYLVLALLACIYIKGEKVEATSSCNCNDSAIANLKNEVSSLQEGIMMLNKSLAEAKTEIKELRQIKKQLRESCWEGIIAGNQCIKLLYTQGYATFYSEAERLCSNYNSTLAEISSDATYEKVYEYVRAKWIIYTDADQPFVDVWLGSTFKADANPMQIITLMNGTTMTWNKWFPGYPLSGESYLSHTKMALEIRTRDTTKNEGLFNTSPYFQYAVPLCAYKILV